MPRSVLVSGAGVAGSCLAWWLDRYGIAVTLVEQAPEPRSGGYVIDFWGLGYDVAEKMGVLGELRRHDLKVQEFRIVNRVGRRISGFNQGAVQKLIKDRGMSLPRSALASALYEAVKDRVNVRFGDSVAGLEDSPRGVEVTFRKGAAEAFDLVIGADGLHSAVRRLCFGEETRFEHFLGYYVAAFTAQGYRFRDPDAYVTYGEPGRQIWRITLDEDTTVFMLVFAESDSRAAPVHDASRQKEVLTRLYAGGGWETVEMLHALQASTDLYFDRVSQIVMPSWTKGRVALIGDACACPSLLAGEGSSMAMAKRTRSLGNWLSRRETTRPHSRFMNNACDPMWSASRRGRAISPRASSPGVRTGCGCETRPSTSRTALGSFRCCSEPKCALASNCRTTGKTPPNLAVLGLCSAHEALVPARVSDSISYRKDRTCKDFRTGD